MIRKASRAVPFVSSVLLVSAGPSASRATARCWARPWAVASLLAVLLGCARTAVPSLSPESLTAPALPGLSPRVIAVRVADRRPVPDNDRLATEQLVASVLGRVLASGGVAVDSDAAHRLFITVQQPLRRSDQLDPATCVEVQSELALWGVSSPAIGITRCATWRRGGAAFGSGVLAFEGAVDDMLRQLDRQLAMVLQRFAPPTFDAARIEAPDFGWLQPREMALTVSERVSADGSSRASLERALESVFERAGIRRTQTAAYRLAWVLRRPRETEPAAPSPCFEIGVEARRERDIFRSAFETCSSSKERLVSKILAALDAHGESRKPGQLPRRPRPPRQPLQTRVTSEEQRLARND